MLPQVGELSGLTVRAAGAAIVVVAALPVLPATAATHQYSAGVFPPDESYVELTLDTVEPAVPQPGDTLRLAGTVTNTSDAPLTNVNVMLRHNGNPLRSRDELRLLDESPRRVWGIRPGSPFFETLTPTLAAGESAEFELETVLDVSCPEPPAGTPPCLAMQFPGVYVTGVDIMATVPSGARVQANTVLTLLPWLVEPEQPVPVAMLWPLVTTPSLLPDGTLTEGSDASLFGPVSAPQIMLRAARDAPVTWMVDPDLLDTANAVASSDSPYASAASSWRDELRVATSTDDPWLLPYAVPDIAAFDHETAMDLATTSMRLTRQSADQLSGARTGMSWPASVTPSALTTLDNVGATPIVLSGALVSQASGPWTTVELEDSQFTALLTDPHLDAAIRNATSGVGLRQRWLAETALAALDPAPAGRALVTGPPPGWQPDLQLATGLIEAWMATPWVEPVRLDDIDDEPHGIATTADPADGNVAALPPGTAEAAAELAAAADQYATLLAEASDREGYSAATVRAASATWSTDPEAGISYADEMTQELRSRLGRVSLSVPPTVTLSSNTGAFPVNVVNDLDVPVAVQLELASSNPDRMSVEPVTRQRIEAQETAIVQVTAEAVANGKVRVDVQLATIDGVPLGDPEYTVVNATNYGVIGWFLIAGASLLFAIGLALRTLRGRRRNGSVHSHVRVRELHEVPR